MTGLIVQVRVNRHIVGLTQQLFERRAVAGEGTLGGLGDGQLLGLDRTTAYRVDPDGERRQVVAAGPSLGPLIGSGFAGIVGSGSF